MEPATDRKRVSVAGIVASILKGKKPPTAPRGYWDDEPPRTITDGREQQITNLCRLINDLHFKGNDFDTYNAIMDQIAMAKGKIVGLDDYDKQIIKSKVPLKAYKMVFEVETSKPSQTKSRLRRY